MNRKKISVSVLVRELEFTPEREREREINALTKGRNSVKNNLPSELTLDVFNAHFASVKRKIYSSCFMCGNV